METSSADDRIDIFGESGRVGNRHLYRETTVSNCRFSFHITNLSKIENRNLVVPMTGLISWAKAEEQAIATFTERRQFETAVSLFI